ncbi:glycoside hydrolase family 24 protein [Agrobacterium fabrum]|uniref:glycoside hydrolase family 24 protein n=1 Tax=Agrobacterium fabrum TaxID=1176649 RepID=UPI0021575971|nr:glycoside hydrolase family 104 protein [Agrobacterium fabrum]MCR6726006.1 glycoside hydrolase family 104 protein [Agrobacterium fabrum]
MNLRDKRDFYEALLDEPNVQRALGTIRAAEGTARYANPYSVGFGGRQHSLAQHPGVSASFRDNSGHRGKTTAAGAYQFLGGTWNEMKNALGLKDFSKKSQDIAAIGLLDRAGALGHVMSGNVKGFVNSAKDTWASFPGAPYNQPTKSMSFMQSAWNSPSATKDIGMLNAIAPDIRNIPTPTARPEPTYTAPLSSVERAPIQEVAMSPFDASRFGPAPTSPVFDATRFASPDAVAQGKAGLQRGLLDQQLSVGILPNIPPAVAPATTYVDPKVSVQPTVAQPTIEVAQPTPARSISQMTTGSVMAPQISERQRQIAAKTTSDMRTRGILGTLGGAVLGGALLGPVGGLLGGYLGKSFSNSGYYPDAPEKLNPGGVDDRSYGGLNDYGQNAYNESKDFRDAVNSGSAGLW